MDKKFIAIFFLIMTCTTVSFAQSDTTFERPTFRIGIFAPLYLDSVFSKNTFRYAKTVPRFIMPALDFVQGAEIALDSLRHGKANIDAVIYDTKSYTSPVPVLIKNKKLDSLQLIVGSVKDEEYLQLANFALTKNIPFISVTYPNNSGITDNPFLVILNPTLISHCEAIFNLLLQQHGTDKIFLCRKPGAQEDMVANYFKQLNEREGNPLLKIETLNIQTDADTILLKQNLDSNRKNILIGASLNETFAVRLSKVCSNMFPTYPITLMGMPNWDGFGYLHKDGNLGGFPVYYTTPYFNTKLDAFSKLITAKYQKIYKTLPTDMSFKGFESVYIFTNLLAEYPDNFLNEVNNKKIEAICSYNIRPVKLNKDNIIPDFFENKHLYFIKVQNGNETIAW